jgi:hypothetical protein
VIDGAASIAEQMRRSVACVRPAQVVDVGDDS